ncbi:MAG: metallophosphoesterase family protein [Bacteroidales bacterium]
MHVGRENTAEFKKNWCEAVDICIDRGIKTIVIGGDLFLSRASQSLNVLLNTKEFIDTAALRGISVIALNGNHDKVNQEHDKGYCHVFSNPHYSVIDDTGILDLDGADYVLHMIGYYPENGSFREKLDIVKSRLHPSKKNYIYIHQGINGALSVSCDNNKELPAAIFDDFDATLVGHYHNRCRIQDTNIFYIGSSRQHNFGEDEDKGYTILHDSGKIEFIKNQINTRYKVMEVPFKKVNDNLLEEICDWASDDYKIKVKIRCTTKEAGLIDKNKLIKVGATKVEVITDDVVERQTTQSAFSRFDKNGIVSAYHEFVSTKDDINVEIGLKYIQEI